jgi:hypothetical protein
LENNEIKYQLTALIDGEIRDESKVAELNILIQANPDLQREFEILRFTKSLVQKNCTFHSAPQKLKQKIVKKIIHVEKPSPQPLEFLKNIFSKPAFAIAGATALIILAVIIVLNQSSVNQIPDLAAEQYGTENMFVQASNNFKSILTGKLKPQIVTDDENNIQKFFASNGVKYSTLIPKCERWKILGAVVSEAGGKKFAHHVYTNSEGKLVYLFQVDESYLNRSEVIKLSEHMMKYLDEGNCYFSSKENFVTLMKKIDNNICAVVSNASKTEIENLFCSL